ncbi:MAG: site-specific integrase [Bacteroidales bacterium]|nr:site-specific integrase [Bacteroidales bacterium]
MKITTYVNKQKVKDGECPVYIRLAKGDEMKYISVGAKLPEKAWDFEKKQIKGDELQYSDVIEKIEKKKKQVRDKLKELGDEIEVISLNTLVEELNESKPKRKRLFVYKYFEKRCNELKDSGKMGNYRAYKTALNKLRGTKDKKGRWISEPFRKSDFLFTELDVPLLRDFESFLRKGYNDQDKRQGTVNIIMRTIRALYNRAAGEAPYLRDYYPFHRIEGDGKYMIPEGNDNHRALESDEIKRLLALNINSDYYRYLIFSFYAGGMAFIDMCFLQWSNIIEGTTLQYQRKKLSRYGGKKGVVRIPLHPEALKTLAYFRTKTGINPAGYIFPVLHTEIYKTATAQHNRVHKIRRVYNSELRIFAAKAGIQGNMTSYRIRHSFFTELARNKQPFYIIKTMGAHVNDQTTMKYINKADEDDLQKALNSL